MPVDGAEAAGAEDEGAGRERVGGCYPGCLGWVCDAEGSGDVQAAAHPGAEGDHRGDIG